MAVSFAGLATTLASSGSLASIAFSLAFVPIRPSIVPLWIKQQMPLKFGVGRDSMVANRNNSSSKYSTPNPPFCFTTNPEGIRIWGWATWNLASNYLSKCRRLTNVEDPHSFHWRPTPSKLRTNKQVRTPTKDTHSLLFKVSRFIYERPF